MVMTEKNTFQTFSGKHREQKNTSDDISKRSVRKGMEWAGGQFHVFACHEVQISPLHACPAGLVSLAQPSCHTHREHCSLPPGHTSLHAPERQKGAVMFYIMVVINGGCWLLLFLSNFILYCCYIVLYYITIYGVFLKPCISILSHKSLKYWPNLN